MDLAGHPDETSLRYPGWRVVAACFLVALFIFGFGLYGHALYLAELQRLHRWSPALISGASTLSFLLGSILAAFTHDLLGRLGPRRLVLLGISALTAATVLLAFTTTPWQLYLAYIMLSLGWTGMGTVVLATILRSWFERRSGLAISLAFNGATCGGIIVAPALVFLTGAIGFTGAMVAATAVMLAVLIPVVIAWIALPDGGANVSPDGGAAAANLSRQDLLRDFGFWTITAPFALGILAQVGFIVHQIAFLEPMLGRSFAGLAVAVTITMALIGRLCLGLIIDRLDPRLATTLSLLTQAGALLALTQTIEPTGLVIACAIYGFSIGNLITLPPLIIAREFEPAAFSAVLGLSTAIGGVVSACGPALVGFVREAAGGYPAALAVCLSLKLLSAMIVLLRPRRITARN